MFTAPLAALLLTVTPLAPRPLSALPSDLQPLVQALIQHGFTLRIALPPAVRAYGQFDPRRRTLWISPLSFELGIARQTLLHEAVHAVQSCPGGDLRPLGWSPPLTPEVERAIRATLIHDYGHHNRLLEREAFALQGQPDAPERLRQALGQRCRLAPRR